MRMGEIASEGEERASQLLEKIKNDVDTCCAETPKAAPLLGAAPVPGEGSAIRNHSHQWSSAGGIGEGLEMFASGYPVGERPGMLLN